MKAKVVVKWLSTLVISTAILAACSSGGTGRNAEASGTEKQLVVWAWDPNFNIKALQIAEEVYEKEQGKEVDLAIVENAQDDMIQKLNTSLSSGVEKGLPNIVLIEDYRAQGFLEAYPDSFFPLTDFIDPADFATYKIASTSLDGENYAIPFDSGVTGLYVRKDILDKAGYKVEDLVNISWIQLQKIGKDILDKTGVKLLSTDMNAGTLIRGMMQSSGSWYTEADGQTPYLKDNASLKEAFKTIKNLHDSGLVNIHNNWSEMLKAFNTGIVATVPSGNWITPSVVAQESQSGQWAVVPWPRQELAGSVNASNLGGASLYVINKDGKEAAADFLAKTFGSSKEFYKEILNQIGAVGTYLPVEETDAYDQEVAFFDHQAIYRDFSSWSKQIPTVHYGKYTYAMEDIIVKSLHDYLNGGDLDEILANAQKNAENQFK